MSEHTGSRVANVILRFFQLCSAAIVAGIIGWGLHRIDRGDGPSNGRLIYAEIVAVLSLVASFVLLIPFKFVFKAWPLDILLLIMWLVAFGLLADLTGTAGCSSSWYHGYWGWYWSGLWMNPTGRVNSRACSNWRAVLAFSGISWILFLYTAIVGIYVFLSREPSEERTTSFPNKLKKPWKREKYGNESVEAGRTNEVTTTSQP